MHDILVFSLQPISNYQNIKNASQRFLLTKSVLLDKPNF